MPKQKTTPEEIIYNSIKVFRRKGYYRTNMSDLAKETGLTKGAFYHHFSNKEEVMKKALQASTGWFQKKVFSIADDSALNAQEKLNTMVSVAFKAFTDDAGGCFFANTILETSHVEDTFLEDIELFFSAWKNALYKIFQDSYPEERLAELTEEIIADVEGSIIFMQLRKDHSYLRKALDRTLLKLKPNLS